MNFTLFFNDKDNLIDK